MLIEVAGAMKVKVVVYREREKWVAQCLEYDIRAQADSMHELMKYLDIAIEETRRDSMERHGEAFAHVDPAPQHFHNLWKRQAGTIEPSRRSSQTSVELALCA